MAATDIRFYLDEHLDVEIARQLKLRGIDVITVRDLRSFGEDDLLQLNRAIRMGRVFCTNDSDLVEIASEGIAHAGIVFGQQEKHFIGTWVKFLIRLQEDFQSEDLVNQVRYLYRVD